MGTAHKKILPISEDIKGRVYHQPGYPINEASHREAKLLTERHGLSEREGPHREAGPLTQRSRASLIQKSGYLIEV